MMTLRRSSFALGALAIAGCAARQIEVSASHPANPAASEAPVPPESATLRNAAPNPSLTEQDELPMTGHGPHHRRGQAATEAPYRCPMHPDVRSDKPGHCPMCGMQLKKGDAQ
jgi:hypothetical protein